MRLGIKQITAITGVFITVFLAIVACNSPSSISAVTPQPKATQPSVTEKVFKAANLAINPSEVNTGVEVLITTTVTNTGSKADSYIGEVRIDKTDEPSLPAFLYSKEVTIPAGASQLLNVTTSMNYPGTYKVSWINSELSGNLVVKLPEGTDTNNTQGTASKTVTAPNFTGVDVVTGKRIVLDQFRGSIVLLNFVNYGCDPSLNQKVGAQLLAIRDLKKQRSNLVPVSVFCGCCPPEVLRQFATENKLDWPWLLDTDSSTVAKYLSYLRKYGYPTLIFIDKDQNIREVTGYADIATLDAKLDTISQN